MELSFPAVKETRRGLQTCWEKNDQYIAKTTAFPVVQNSRSSIMLSVSYIPTFLKFDDEK